MYFTYILRSESSGRFYIGSTDHLIRRYDEHQRGKNRATRNRGPWFMPYYEIYATRSEAVRRERQIKSMKSRDYLLALIDEPPQPPMQQT